MIIKLFKTIYPSNDITDNDKRVNDVLKYARNVERGMFESANDKVKTLNIHITNIPMVHNNTECGKKKRSSRTNVVKGVNIFNTPILFLTDNSNELIKVLR